MSATVLLVTPSDTTRDQLVALMSGEIRGWEAYRKDTDAATKLTLEMFPDAGLDPEVQKLQAQRPATLGQAGRISGVTPAAISLLLVHLKKGGFKGFDGAASPRAAEAA